MSGLVARMCSYERVLQDIFKLLALFQVLCATVARTPIRGPRSPSNIKNPSYLYYYYCLTLIALINLIRSKAPFSSTWS